MLLVFHSWHYSRRVTLAILMSSSSEIASTSLSTFGREWTSSKSAMSPSLGTRTNSNWTTKNRKDGNSWRSISWKETRSSQGVRRWCKQCDEERDDTFKRSETKITGSRWPRLEGMRSSIRCWRSHPFSWLESETIVYLLQPFRHRTLSGIDLRRRRTLRYGL